MKKNPPLPARVVSTPGALPTPSAEGIVDIAPMPLPPPPVGIVPEPSLPDPAFAGDRVADLYVAGCAAMKAGQNAEAIKALEGAVELDPSFADAWTKLVVLYQNAGEQKKAVEAYRKVKHLGQPSGAGSGASFSGGLGLVP